MNVLRFPVALLTCALFCSGSAGRLPLRQAPVLPELQVYVDARTVIDQTPAELIESLPELVDSLTFTEDQSVLPGLLKEIGRNVENFFAEFPNTASIEEVRQDVLSSDGRMMKRTRGEYQYLMLSSSGGSIGLDEYRTNPKGKESNPRGPEVGFMLTTRCVWHLVHFHPRYQADSRYRYLGLSAKPKAHVIAFAQRPAAAREVARIGVWDPTLLGQKVLMLIQGLVWVDPASLQIIRARTELLAPRPDIGLTRNTTEIECAEIRFSRSPRSFWLPVEATITAIFRNFTYRNRHRYSEYQLFSVETQEKVARPVPP